MGGLLICPVVAYAMWWTSGKVGGPAACINWTPARPAGIQKTGDSALSGLEKGPIDDNVYRDDYNNKLRNGAGQFREISLIRSSPAMTSESGECVVASADA
jgi:hypothetical protein